MLNTEKRNEKTRHIDQLSPLEQVRLMNEENRNSVEAVERALPQVALAVEAATEALLSGGRILYMGAGTSGRLGVIDASECPPTFGVSPETVRGIIAGGKERMFSAAENAEDIFENGYAEAKEALKPGDLLVGISAAGGAKYVLGAFAAARELGCTTVGLTCNEGVPVATESDIPIVCDTGAEVITGSTRLKAGNSQKFVLNMISTCAMIRTGKVYENLMINLRPTNEKLKERVIRITCEILECSREEAIRRLEANQWEIRAAVRAE